MRTGPRFRVKVGAIWSPPNDCYAWYYDLIDTNRRLGCQTILSGGLYYSQPEALNKGLGALARRVGHL